MFALQSIVQQQGSHQQIFLPPRAPHQQLMQKVFIHNSQFNRISQIIQFVFQYLQSGPPPMSGIATPPNKRGRSPSPTPQYYKPNNPPYSQNQSKFHNAGGKTSILSRQLFSTPKKKKQLIFIIHPTYASNKINCI